LAESSRTRNPSRGTLFAVSVFTASRTVPQCWARDRGVQSACGEYVKRLEAAGARVSMSAKGTPRENAQAERFFRTPKEEEVYLHEYETYEESEQSIGEFIAAVYNEKRLHSALGYRPPTEFERLCATGLLLEK
jgi:putative transposase